MSHLYFALPQYCLSTHTIIDLLTQTYSYKVFLSWGFLASHQTFFASFVPLVLLFGMWLYDSNAQSTKTVLTCHGKASLVMLCPIFFLLLEASVAAGRAAPFLTGLSWHECRKKKTQDIESEEDSKYLCRRHIAYLYI